MSRETVRPLVREYLQQRSGVQVSVGEVCEALSLHPYRSYATVQRAMIAIGAEVVGRYTPHRTHKKGGRGKPIYLWALKQRKATP